MKKVTLSPNGPSVSRLIYGTWRIKSDPEGFSPRRILDKIHACLDVGITTFDLAEIYGNYECEAIFGAALRLSPGLRDRIEIVTKCGIINPSTAYPDVHVKHYNATAPMVSKAVDKALTNLGTDRIDLLLIHRPDWLTRADDTARGLDLAVDSGKVRSAGVSNYSESAFSLLASKMRNPLVTNQIELSLFEMKSLYDGVLAQCEERGIHPMAWSPLGGGRLFTAEDPVAQRIRAAAETLGPHYGGATAEQIALAWILALPSQPVAVFGSNHPVRIHSAALADSISLRREDWYLLWSAAQGRDIP